MTGGKLRPLLYGYSRLAFMHNPIKRYGHGSKGSHSRLMEERAPSVAQEFERVAAEKVQATEQGEPGQTAAGKAALDNSKVDESGKKSSKQHEAAAADYQRRGVNN